VQTLVAVSIWVGGLIALVSAVAILQGQVAAVVGLLVGVAVVGWGLKRHGRFDW